MEWFYKAGHPEYTVPDRAELPQMEFIYPEPGSSITLPRQLDGSPGGVVVQLAHRRSSATVYWHLDNVFLGTTHIVHTLKISPSEGRHSLTAVDDKGESVSVSFSIDGNQI
jgi:penicillin-binding protein 1C